MIRPGVVGVICLSNLCVYSQLSAKWFDGQLFFASYLQSDFAKFYNQIDIYFKELIM